MPTVLEAPPIGLRPRWVVAEERIQEIKEACNRYYNSNTEVPREWLEELHELLAYIRMHRLKEQKCYLIEIIPFAWERVHYGTIDIGVVTKNIE